MTTIVSQTQPSHSSVATVQTNKQEQEPRDTTRAPVPTPAPMEIDELGDDENAEAPRPADDIEPAFEEEQQPRKKRRSPDQQLYDGECCARDRHGAICGGELTGPVQADAQLCELHLRRERERQRRQNRQAEIDMKPEVHKSKRYRQAMEKATEEVCFEGRANTQLATNLRVINRKREQFLKWKKRAIMAKAEADANMTIFLGWRMELAPEITAALERRERRLLPRPAS